MQIKRGVASVTLFHYSSCTNLTDQKAKQHGKHCTLLFGGRTFRSLLEAQPAHCAVVAAVAADAGGAGGAGVQRDGPDHQGQGERQVQAARDVHVHLRQKKTKKNTSMRRSGSIPGRRFCLT